MNKAEEKIYACVLSTHTAGMGLIRSLGEAGIPVIAVYYENKDMGFVSRYVSAKFKCPNPEYDERGFINSLLQIGRKFPGSVLFPADDETLTAVSNNVGLLSELFNIRALSAEAAGRVLNKEITYAIAKEAGIDIPNTFQVDSVDEAEKAAESLGYPLLIKPKYSHSFFRKFKVKMFTAYNAGETARYLRLAEEGRQAVMLQEYIPGGDECGYNFNSIRIPGSSIISFTAQKIRMSGSGKGVPVVVRSVQHIDEIVEKSKRLLESLNYFGYSCIEYKKDSRTGRYILMEINGRFNRSILLSYKCGINFPEIAYNYAVDKISRVNPQYKTGLYWIDEVRDFQIILQKIRSSGTGIGEILSPYRSGGIKAVGNIKDPLPLMKRFFDLGLMVFRALYPQKKLVRIEEGEIPPAEKHIKKVNLSVNK